MVIAGKYKVSERSGKQLAAFFTSLIDQGLQPISCTIDGNPQVIRTLRQLWPDILIQRCLVHIQRQGLSWCRRNPKTAAARQLRTIFLQVTSIHTREQQKAFIEKVIRWEQHYGMVIDTRPERGRVFSDIKRARSMLLHALPDMFYYLDNPAIPFSTNRLEGYFSRLKAHYRQHRGLAPEKLHYYFAWYIYFTPR